MFHRVCAGGRPALDDTAMPDESRDVRLISILEKISPQGSVQSARPVSTRLRRSFGLLHR